MSSEIIDWGAPSLQGGFPRRAEDLPRGLLTPPDRVRELIEQERAKHPPEVFARWEERLLNEWTIQYYFDYLGHEVLYRDTPQGPVVLAVGHEEVLPLRKSIPLEEWQGIQTFLGY